MIIASKLLKTIILAVVSVFLVSYVGVKTLLLNKVPQQVLQDTIQKEMTKAFRRPVTVGRLESNIFNQLTIYDIRIQDSPKSPVRDILVIKQLRVNYALSKLIKTKGDGLAAVTRCYFNSCDVNLVRSKSDRWNIIDLITPPPDVEVKPLTFTGQVVFNDLNIQFLDQKGWKAGGTAQPFRSRFLGVSGLMNYRNPKKTTFKLTGKMYHQESPFTIDGVLNSHTGAYSLNMHIPEVNLDDWGDYVFPITGYHLNGNTVRVDGHLQSLPPPVKGIPFRYQLQIGLSQNTFKMPIFNDGIRVKSGTLLMTNEAITFKQLTGELSEIPFQANGGIDHTKNTINLAVVSDTFKTEQIKRLFPSLKTWKFSGESLARLTVSGELEKTRVSGNIQTPNLKVYALKFSKVGTSILFADKKLKFKVGNATLYKGDMKAEGQIDFHPSKPELAIDFSGKALQLPAMFTTMGKRISGTMQLKGHVAGDTSDFKVSTMLLGEKAQIYNQTLDVGKLEFQVKRSDIYIKPSYVILNNSFAPLRFHGEIQDLVTAKIRFESEDLFIRNVQFDTDRRGNGSIKGALAARLSPRFWSKPMDEVVCSAAIRLNEYPLSNSVSLEKGQLEFVFDKNKLDVQRLEGDINRHHLLVSGQFLNANPIALYLKTDELDLKDLPIPGKNQLLNKGISFQGLQVDGVIKRLPEIANSPTFNIRHYELAGGFQISNLLYQNQKFDRIALSGKWNGKRAEIDQAKVAVNNSVISAKGIYDKSGAINMDIENGSQVTLSDFYQLLRPYGNFQGEVNIVGSISGQIPKPTMDLNVLITKAQYNYLSFDEISGHVRYETNLFSSKGIFIQKDKTQYRLSGNIDLNALKKGGQTDLGRLGYDIKLGVSQADLYTLTDIVEGLYKDFKRKITSPANEKVQLTSIPGKDVSNYAVSDGAFKQKIVPLFEITGVPSSLSVLESIRKKISETENPRELGLSTVLKGMISGELIARQKPNQRIDLYSDIQLDNPEIYFIKAQKIALKAYSDDQGIHADLSVNRGNLGGRDFDKITTQVVYNPQGNLEITQASIVANNRINDRILTGTIPLAYLWDPVRSKDGLNLIINLVGDDIGVFSIFNPNIKDITNKGNVRIGFTGSLDQPMLNATEINLDQAKLFFTEATSLKSPFQITQNKIRIINNKILIPETDVLWQGEDTRSLDNSSPRENHFIVSGNIDLQNLTFIKPDYMDVDMNLRIRNTNIAVNLGNIYTGEVGLRNLKVTGPYRIPFSFDAKERYFKTVETEDEVGPVISAEATLANGKVVFPTLEKRKTKPTFHLNINARINQNVTVAGSVFGSGLLAALANNFDLNLQPSQESISVRGTLNAPEIGGRLILSGGSAFLINRVFDLLPLEKQSVFYKDKTDEIYPNNLQFITANLPNSKKRRIMPVMDIKARTIIDVATSNVVAGTTRVKDVVIRFKGPLNNLKSLSFEEYPDPDVNGEKPDILQRKIYDASQPQELSALLRALIPGLEPNSQQGQLVQSLTENLFQSRVLRPMEQLLAQQIGLYDIRSVNIGKAISGAVINQFGDKNTANTQENPVFIDWTSKFLVDRLFLRVRTNLDLNSEAQKQANLISINEFELTYYLPTNITVNFTNNANAVPTQKLALKYTYEF